MRRPNGQRPQNFIAVRPDRYDQMRNSPVSVPGFRARGKRIRRTREYKGKRGLLISDDCDGRDGTKRDWPESTTFTAKKSPD